MADGRHENAIKSYPQARSVMYSTCLWWNCPGVVEELWNALISFLFFILKLYCIAPTCRSSD